jgi:hypothetical protein
MLITTKEHAHQSMIDQVDRITRGLGLVTKTTASRATKYPQFTGGATKKEMSIRVGSIIKKIIPKAISPDTSIHQQRTYLMDLVVSNTHTSMGRGFQTI